MFGTRAIHVTHPLGTGGNNNVNYYADLVAPGSGASHPSDKQNQASHTVPSYVGGLPGQVQRMQRPP